MFGKILDQLSASFVEESVGKTCAADSVQQAEWDGFFGVV